MYEHPHSLTSSGGTGICIQLLGYYHNVKMQTVEKTQFLRWTFSLIHRKLDEVPDFTICAPAVAATTVFSTLYVAASFTFAILLLFRLPWVPWTSSSKFLSYWSAQPKPYESCLSYDAIFIMDTNKNVPTNWRTRCPIQQQRTKTLSERQISTKSAKTTLDTERYCYLEQKLSNSRYALARSSVTEKETSSNLLATTKHRPLEK